MNYRRVHLDLVPALRFAKSDVLGSLEAKRERQHRLMTATALTNLDNEDVGLVVRLEDGESVELMSNLIDLEGDFVELKGGLIIPLRAIEKVEM
jgi:hypothetical protein